MRIIGKVDSLWRYPVKSMRGEELDEAFASYSGIYGDRVFGLQKFCESHGIPVFHSSRTAKAFAISSAFSLSGQSSAPN